MIDKVSVAAQLLKTLAPEFSLREGASVVARVASRAEQHGIIVLAGVPLSAELPPEVESGQTLHLKVAEVTEERVTLRLDTQAAPPAFVPPPPGGWDPLSRPTLAIAEPPRRPPGGDEDSGTVALAFDSPALGRLDLRIDLASGAVRTTVEADVGRAHDAAAAAAKELEDALAEATGRPAAVRIVPRRRPFDAYA